MIVAISRFLCGEIQNVVNILSSAGKNKQPVLAQISRPRVLRLDPYPAASRVASPARKRRAQGTAKGYAQGEKPK